LSIKFEYIPFSLTDEFIKEYLCKKSKEFEHILLKDLKMTANQQTKNEHNDVYIYKTIFYPPKSKPSKTN